MSAAADAWEAFKASVPPEVYPTYEETFMFAYSRALEDAADAMGKQLDTFPARGANTRARWAEKWLRFRAAATAPDPRETKD